MRPLLENRVTLFKEDATDNPLSYYHIYKTKKELLPDKRVRENLLTHETDLPEKPYEFFSFYNDDVLKNRMEYYKTLLEGLCGKQVWNIIWCMDTIDKIQKERQAD
jgi:hypothetical protein